MTKYKTVVVDYEGMQECMDQHAGQGWRLFCVNADTWRRMETEVLGSSAPPNPMGMPADDSATEAYSVSYYLLVFYREEDPRHDTSRAEATEELPHSERSRRSY